MIKIAFDIDGVVLRSIEVILEHINESTGKTLGVNDLLTWDLEPLGLTRDTLWNSVDHMYRQDYIEPYEGAEDVLWEIYELTGQPLLFITGRHDPTTARKQLESLNWPVRTPEIIVTGGDRDKRLYLNETGANFIVEDDYLHVRDYLGLGIGVGLMVQPWNKNCEAPVTCKFDRWHDVREWFVEGMCNS
ncbi:MAG: hypothetical protein AB7V04_03680 [Desulfomonilaceae bacterium]